ncbi:VOC family protein [Pararhizobium mangrovi]|uniref:VOC family protein n=1 Tax=Pararhizobium mangrovi TaxID=2590452 RepID=A0A506U121_9HYPH|nr:VOC family protein [Pararhizobium mangrovi]TPW26674.1 VOC family protein [Pararhizobium mangrovi]
MVAFYDAVLAPSDLKRRESVEAAGPAGVIWYMEGKRCPQFAIRAPFDGEAARAGNGVQVSFAVSDGHAVEACWRAALDAGGTDEGEPGIRVRYAPDFFAAYCRDPEGNKLCFVHAEGL